MNRKLPALLALCLLVFAGRARALETDELIAITAMPLAVAEVAALPEVPQGELVTVVTTLNQAVVPAPQFIEIVRYAPVALVDTRTDPRFVSYITEQYGRGVVGQPLALSIADRYQTYGIREVNVIDPPVVTIVERQILPPVVVTRFQPVEFDPLALIAMPLAVAAVADIADVPRSDLINFVSALNQALVPAPQFVEVVRYSPVMLVDRTQSPQFIQFVRTEIDRGVIGRPLAFAIAERIDIDDIDVVRPRTAFIVDRDVILPPVVVTRAARSHPHGGPPGQLKKQLGLQTGAEVVHGDRVAGERRVRPRKVRTERAPKPRVTRSRGRDDDDGRVRVRREAPKPPAVKNRGRDDGRGRSPRVSGRDADRGQKGRAGQGKSQSQGKGKGKGKGKG